MNTSLLYVGCSSCPSVGVLVDDGGGYHFLYLPLLGELTVSVLSCMGFVLCMCILDLSPLCVFPMCAALCVCGWYATAGSVLKVAACLWLVSNLLDADKNLCCICC